TAATLNLGNVNAAAAGNYDVIVRDALGGSTTSSVALLRVNKASATVTVPPVFVSYTTGPHAASATTTPPGLGVIFSYVGTGSTTYGPTSSPPVGSGTYTVTATINNSDYQGTGTAPLTISKASAPIVLGSLSVDYDGRPHGATATTTPPGLPVTFTYNGSNIIPTNAGSYPVVATVNHANYAGSANGTLTIARIPATLTFGGLTATYDGTPRNVTSTTAPASQAVVVTYEGISGTTYGPSTTAPTAPSATEVLAIDFLEDAPAIRAHTRADGLSSRLMRDD
ncbi:MAG: MBG domain-containing protein, partial [Verrucomicrobiota bacterium]